MCFVVCESLQHQPNLSPDCLSNFNCVLHFWKFFKNVLDVLKHKCRKHEQSPSFKLHFVNVQKIKLVDVLIESNNGFVKQSITYSALLTGNKAMILF